MTMPTIIPLSVASVPIVRKFAAYLANCINNWLAAWIARQERLAARKTLLSFGDRQFKDVGLARSYIDDVIDNPAERD